MKPLQDGQKPLNVRQERFVELVASGMPATQAYKDAGYSDRGKKAESNAHTLSENHGVKARIAELRAEARSLARKSKAQKLAMLEEIAWSKKAKHSDVIAALKVHNEITGEQRTRTNALRSVARCQEGQ